MKLTGRKKDRVIREKMVRKKRKVESSKRTIRHNAHMKHLMGWNECGPKLEPCVCM